MKIQKADVPPVLVAARDASRTAGRLPTHPPAHDRPLGRSEGVQQHPRLAPAADRANHRLPAHAHTAPGGISSPYKIAAVAELDEVRTGCHGANDLCPVSMAAALHPISPCTTSEFSLISWARRLSCQRQFGCSRGERPIHGVVSVRNRVRGGR